MDAKRRRRHQPAIEASFGDRPFAIQQTAVGIATGDPTKYYSHFCPNPLPQLLAVASGFKN
jgi:hypothetical protein